MAIPTFNWARQRYVHSLRALIADPEFELTGVCVIGRQSRQGCGRVCRAGGIDGVRRTSTDLNAARHRAAVRRLQRDGRQSAA